jgi:lysophospholipase L1-like esterase
VGSILSLTLAGMTFAPFLLASGGIVLAYAVFQAFATPESMFWRALAWTGRHSYSLYLAHHPVVKQLLPTGTPLDRGAWLRIVAAFVISLALALFIERLSDFGEARLRAWSHSERRWRSAVRLLATAVLLFGALLGCELLVWRAAPQEVLGWGERPALEPHPRFGWRLRPSQVTRLRWETYDYVVTANALGFPGPEFPLEKGRDTFRILTTGDAFSSAEGVDTTVAWPRLLELDLGERLPATRVEVLNFAITGYGPNEYAAVIEAFVPAYRPDLVIVEFFVNEFDDVLHGPEFAQSIGFERPPADGIRALLRLSHLRHVVQTRLRAPLVSRLRGTPEPYGCFLGNLAALERREDDQGARALVAERLERIKTTVDAVGARALLLLVPASVQVCAPQELDYFPHHVDLSDSAVFDLERPQRITRSLAEPLGFSVVDLRPLLRAAGEDCPYQRWNMHWTAEGHRRVARRLADILGKDALVGSDEALR